MTLLEGLGNGLPLISFDIPTGPSEIIEDGKNGFLLQENDVCGMENRLQQLMSNESMRATLSKECLKKNKAFAIEDIKNEWEKALRAVV